jgi:hypothetical protein
MAIVRGNWRLHVDELAESGSCVGKRCWSWNLGLGKQKRGEPTRARAQSLLAQRDGLDLFDHQATLEQSKVENLAYQTKGQIHYSVGRSSTVRYPAVRRSCPRFNLSSNNHGNKSTRAGLPCLVGRSICKLTPATLR